MIYDMEEEKKKKEGAIERDKIIHAIKSGPTLP